MSVTSAVKSAVRAGPMARPGDVGGTATSGSRRIRCCSSRRIHDTRVSIGNAGAGSGVVTVVVGTDLHEHSAAHARITAKKREENLIGQSLKHTGFEGYTGASLDFRYLAIEGPIGLGKTTLAERLAARLDATLVLDDTDNPFLADFYDRRPGAAFQSQLFFTLSRHRQQMALRQGDLFCQTTICNYLFDRDRIYAFLNLSDNELFIYQRLFDLLARDLPAPDLVIYLQSPVDLLKRRLREHVYGGRKPASRCRLTRTWPRSTKRTRTFSFTTRPRRCWSSKRRILISRGAMRCSTTFCARSRSRPKARDTTCREPDEEERGIYN